MEIRPQPPLTRQSAPTAFALRNITDRKARGRLRAATTAEAVGTELEWTDAGGWRYQLERPPVVTISPKDIHRAAATVDLRVWDASNTLIFRDRIHAWDGFPVLVPDGTEHEEDDGLGGKVRVSNFRESPVEAARSDLAHTVRVVTKNGPWVRATPGTVDTFYGVTGDGYVRSASTTYSIARTGGTKFTTTSTLLIGQGTNFWIWETFLGFDTSSIADDAVIEQVDLSLWLINDASTTNFDIQVRGPSTWMPTLTTGDWISGASVGAITLLATLPTATGLGATGAYYTFPENGTNFQEAINRTGNTELILNSSRHEAGNQPSTAEYVGFSSSAATGTTNDPKLVVTHTTPATASSISVSYGSKTRTGPSNTPWTLNFTGAGGLTTYQVRTGSTSGAGTQVATGTASDGSNNKTIAYNASGITQGDQTLYLFVSNDSGSTWSSGYSFTLKRDDSVASPTGISTSPNPVVANKQYSVTFNAPDTYSTSTNEMTYQIRTASGGGGTLVGSGVFTQGNSRTTSTHTDNDLVNGNNDRWLRIFDGANNVAETQFVVDALLSVSVNISGVVAEVSSQGLAGSVAAQVAVTVGGVPATVMLDALAGLITAVRSVSLSGTVAEISTAALVGQVVAEIVATVPGEAAQVALSALAGIVEAIAGGVDIAGVPASMGLDALAGVVEALRQKDITGQPATLDAEALAGIIAAQRIIDVSGNVATANLEALAGTAQGQRVISVIGQAAATSLDALAGSVSAQRVIVVVGESAGLGLDALIGVALAQNVIAVAGVPAMVDLAALAGSVSVVRIAAVGGVMATVALDALPGVVATSRVVSISGALAETVLAALPGTPTTSQVVSVSGQPTTLGLDALAGSVATSRIVDVSGAVATLGTAALAGGIEAQRVIAIAGPAANLGLEALAGTLSVERFVTVTGATADLALEALAGDVGTGKIITGVAANMGLEALAGTVVVQRVVGISGQPATLDLGALVGNVSLAATILGATAVLDADALAGSVAASRVVSIAGEAATLGLEALPGAAGASGNATIGGQPATVGLEAFGGTISATVAVDIAGAVAALGLEALAAGVSAQRIVDVIGEVAALTLMAVPGIVSTVALDLILATASIVDIVDGTAFVSVTLEANATRAERLDADAGQRPHG